MSNNKRKYRLIGAELTFYNEKKSEVEFEKGKFFTEHPKIVEELILDGFRESGMKNPPVKCKLKIEYLCNNA